MPSGLRLRLEGDPECLRRILSGAGAKEIWEDYAQDASLWGVSQAMRRIREDHAAGLSEGDFPDAPTPHYDRWERLEGDWGVISDLHVPYHDRRALARYAEEVRRCGIRGTIIAGDLVDSNQLHPRRGMVQHERRLQEDLELAGEIVRVLARMQDRVVVLMGNHDAWIVHHMRRHFDAGWLFSSLLRTGEGVTFSDYSRCEVVSGGRRVCVLHGRHSSASNPLGVARKYAAKFECSVVMGHQHASVAGWSDSSRHRCVVIGGMFDPRKMQYLQMDPTHYPAPTPSFAVIQQGVITVHEIGYTERSEEGEEGV